MKKFFLIAFSLLCISSALQAGDYVPSAQNVQAREQFRKQRFGIFIHWGIYSMRGRGEWALQVDSLKQSEYSRMAAGFYPSKFDAQQWARIFKNAGARYITITSRHHDGFSMFDTAASDYDIIDASPFKRDVIAELSAACAKEGLGFNLYYSILDWGRDDYWPRGRTGLKTGRPDGKEGDWERYHDFMDAQITELLTKYGPIGAIWLDGLWDMDMYPREDQPEIWKLDRHYKLVHDLQPSCLVGNNHHMLPFPGEDIQIFERDIPGYNEGGLSGQDISKLPLETCQTMNWSWGYDMSDTWYKPAGEFIQYLVRTAGKGANLLLNVGPRADGTIPEDAVDRLTKMGEWLAVYGDSIYDTDGGYISEQDWGVTTQRGKRLFMHVLKENQSIEIEIPDGNKIVSAKAFDSNAAVAFKHNKGKAVITLPARQDNCPDQIIVIDFKKEL